LAVAGEHRRGCHHLGGGTTGGGVLNRIRTRSTGTDTSEGSSGPAPELEHDMSPAYEHIPVLLHEVIDALNPQQNKALLDEVYQSGIRMNRQPPRVTIKRKAKGGVDVGSRVKLTKITKETIKAICREMKYTNADVLIKENLDVDGFIDAIEDCGVVADACSFIIQNGKFIIEAKGMNSARSEFSGDEAKIEAELVDL